MDRKNVADRGWVEGTRRGGLQVIEENASNPRAGFSPSPPHYPRAKNSEGTGSREGWTWRNMRSGGMLGAEEKLRGWDGFPIRVGRTWSLSSLSEEGD